MQEEVLSQLEPFWDILSQHRCVKSLGVFWGLGVSTGHHYYLPLYRCIADQLLQVVDGVTNSQLSSLRWTYPRQLHIAHPAPKHFHHFQNLESFSLNVYSSDLSTPPFSAPPLLDNLVLRNSKLLFLMISCYSHDPVCYLEELLPRGTKVLALECLKVTGILACEPLDTQAFSQSSVSPALPKVPHLRDITLQIEDPDKAMTGKASPDVDLLWYILKQPDARLQVVSLQYGISEALMNYLASYRGLKNCKFDTSILPLQLAKHSTSFLKSVLPRHVSSLTSLCITCKNRRHRPGWESMEFNPKTWPQPSAFLNLTQLAVITANDWKLNAENCQVLVDYATGIPKLVNLNVNWSEVGIVIRNLFVDMEDIADKVLVRKRRSLQSFRITLGSSIEHERMAKWTIGPGSPYAQASEAELMGEEEGSLLLSSFAYKQYGRDHY